MPAKKKKKEKKSLLSFNSGKVILCENTGANQCCHHMDAKLHEDDIIIFIYMRGGRGQHHDLNLWLCPLQRPRWLTGACVSAYHRSGITLLEPLGGHTDACVRSSSSNSRHPTSESAHRARRGRREKRWDIYAQPPFGLFCFGASVKTTLDRFSPHSFASLDSVLISALRWQL